MKKCNQCMDSRCPLKLKNLPTEPCSKGREAINAAFKGEDPDQHCPWYINSAEHQFCFFKYMKDDGINHSTSTSKISQLLMLNDFEVKKIFQNFKRKYSMLFIEDSKDK